MVRRKKKSTFQSFSSRCPSTNDSRKTNLAGKKSGNQKRRARLPEPELFKETIIEEEPNEQVTPVKSRTTGNEANAWQVAYCKILKF